MEGNRKLHLVATLQLQAPDGSCQNAAGDFNRALWGRVSLRDLAIFWLPLPCLSGKRAVGL